MAPKKIAAWAVRLEEVLEGRGLGPKRLATIITELNGGIVPGGGSAENLRAYRKGLVRNPRPSIMRLVSQALGVRYEWLMDGELPMTREEERVSDLAHLYGEGLEGAGSELAMLRMLGGQNKDEPQVVLLDAEAVTPAFFLTWRRLVQLRSPPLKKQEIRDVGTKLRMHLTDFLGLTTELNGNHIRSVKWYTDVALAWLSAIAVTAAWDRVDG